MADDIVKIPTRSTKLTDGDGTIELIWVRYLESLDTINTINDEIATIDDEITDLDTAVALNTTHRSSDGKDHVDVVLNNAHRVSSGVDHTFIDQDVRKAASVLFNLLKIGVPTGTPATGIHVEDKGGIQVVIKQSGDTPVYLKRDSNRGAQGQSISADRYYWDGTEVARIEVLAGADAVNKDEGQIRFMVAQGGVLGTVAKFTQQGDLQLTSGKGVEFTTTSVSTGVSGSRTLDDFEIGTFTPAVTFSSSDGDLSMSSQVGRYTKIGNRVFFNLQVIFTHTTGSGTLVLAGLPFTSANVIHTALSTAKTKIGITGAEFQATVPPNAATCALSLDNQNRSGSVNVTQARTDSSGANNTLRLAGHYET